MTDALARQRDDQLAFVAGFVHELRNPLAGVKAAAQLIGAEDAASVRAHALEMMEEEMDRVGRLTDDVLDTLRVEAGHLDLRRSEVDLAALAVEIARTYAPRSARHTLVVDAPAAVRAFVDPLRVRQLLHNLVDNAIRYSPEGGRVVLAVEERDGAAEVRVSDPGIGLGPADLAELFSPFRRRASTVAAGTGLGLSVVKRICDAHGGAIRVESTPGAGSTFCVTLPLAA
ncbi:MAG: HAMP domain-containing histidine kinase [Sandaracinaceae bacterium]|nr:HAMP domain-containing histidine kinase [Sandaracinaceae bacterium]